MAISWLHIIREHPAFLPKYTTAFEPRQGLQLLFESATRSARNYIGYLFRIGQTLLAHETNLSGLTIQPKTCDIVFISHLLNRSHIGQSNDFYFGDVPRELARQGHSVAIVFINHTSAPIRNFPEVWRNSSVNRIILSKSFDWPICERFNRCDINTMSQVFGWIVSPLRFVSCASSVWPTRNRYPI